MALVEPILNMAGRAQTGDLSLGDELAHLPNMHTHALYASFVFETAVEHDQLELAWCVRKRHPTPLSVRAACALLGKPAFFDLLDDVCAHEGGQTLANVLRLQCTMPNLGFGERCLGLLDRTQRAWSETVFLFDEVAKGLAQKEEAWKKDVLFSLLPLVGFTLAQLCERHPLISTVFDEYEATRQHARIAQQIAPMCTVERRKKI